MLKVDLPTLQTWLVDRGLVKSGAKAMLAWRLLHTLPLPPALVQRKKEKLWVPGKASGLSAILVCCARTRGRLTTGTTVGERLGEEWSKEQAMQTAEKSGLAGSSMFGCVVL